MSQRRLPPLIPTMQFSRGTLVELPCGCRTTTNPDDSYDVRYCPRHEEAHGAVAVEKRRRASDAVSR
jgi:hypothetical protein